jgi:uncharacterized protein (DUF433 family)
MNLFDALSSGTKQPRIGPPGLLGAEQSQGPMRFIRREFDLILQPQPQQVQFTVDVGESMHGQANFDSQLPLALKFLRQKLAKSPDYIRQAVAMDPMVMHGNPVFVGTRVPLYVVVRELASGADISEVLEGYPSVNVGMVQAGLEFAASLLRIYDD